MYLDIDDSKHSQVSITTFFFFFFFFLNFFLFPRNSFLRPVSASRTGQERWGRWWRFWSLSMVSQKQTTTTKAETQQHTHTQKGQVPQKCLLQNEDVQCKFHLFLLSFLQRTRTALAFQILLSGARAVPLQEEEMWVQGRCYSSLEASPHSRWFRG